MHTVPSFSSELVNVTSKQNSRDKNNVYRLLSNRLLLLGMWTGESVYDWQRHLVVVEISGKKIDAGSEKQVVAARLS
jgi:hypothetical protein